MSCKTYMAIDPGIADIGVIVYRKDKIILAEKIKTYPQFPMKERVKKALNETLQIYREQSPDVVLIEDYRVYPDPYSIRGANTLRIIGALQYNIENAVMVEPNDWRKWERKRKTADYLKYQKKNLTPADNFDKILHGDEHLIDAFHMLRAYLFTNKDKDE